VTASAVRSGRSASGVRRRAPELVPVRTRVSTPGQNDASLWQGVCGRAWAEPSGEGWLLGCGGVRSGLSEEPAVRLECRSRWGRVVPGCPPGSSVCTRGRRCHPRPDREHDDQPPVPHPNRLRVPLPHGQLITPLCLLDRRGPQPPTRPNLTRGSARRAAEPEDRGTVTWIRRWRRRRGGRPALRG
jgi:hypothetical protein